MWIFLGISFCIAGCLARRIFNRRQIFCIAHICHEMLWDERTRDRKMEEWQQIGRSVGQTNIWNGKYPITRIYGLTGEILTAFTSISVQLQCPKANRAYSTLHTALKLTLDSIIYSFFSECNWHFATRTSRWIKRNFRPILPRNSNRKNAQWIIDL